jgi:hypothetical protein
LILCMKLLHIQEIESIRTGYRHFTRIHSYRREEG